MSGSVSFDRAAGSYDRTRALAPDTMAAVISRLTEELHGRRPVLEVGVGTGRIALPLAGAGVEVVGLDLSRPMLRELVAKRPGAHMVPVVRGDATCLPFGRGAFGAAYVVHLLHLVPAWPDVVAELVRVVRPGGVVLVEMGNPGDGVAHEINRRFERSAGLERRHPGLVDGTEALDREMAAHGARLRLLDPVVETRTVRPDRYIGRLEENVFSWTWPLDDATRARAAAEVRAWASEHVGALDHPQPVTLTIAYRAYDLP